ncbi:TPA: trypsin-like peptidase domain-containing protein [Escherichia coli]|nr:trypsin-like peptidase domain-containing protein [Escherichia coli]HCO6672326.1 trypsin-like peptidase domain-containing protein [Escherichia coli]HCO6809943.1 trypsin-like peptidase domain-containing protein [Escherichia coli]HCO9451397.1 trypsin-like peptidase domain-containing protein [Escherichia coli]HCO9965412.1 trypsin-like peptidase domain-containing protein [Escherichia coli]
MHQHIANATFQVIAGTSCGSGFSFIRADLVVTNWHVVKPLVDLATKQAIGLVKLVTESAQELQAQIVHVDLANDFAILKLLESLPNDRVVLQPATEFNPTRGLRLIFAGYPHGLPQLLTSEAIISAPMTGGQFAIDGMVNGGNSGGPIVLAETGNVVGVVTERRYVGGENAKEIADKAEALLKDVNNMQMSISFGGIDFGRINSLYAESLSTIVQVLNSNANPGIGIGFPLKPIIEAIETL